VPKGFTLVATPLRRHYALAGEHCRTARRSNRRLAVIARGPQLAVLAGAMLALDPTRDGVGARCDAIQDDVLLAVEIPKSEKSELL